MADGSQRSPELDPELAKMIEALVDRKVDERMGALEKRVEETLATAGGGLSDRATILVFSGDMDRLMSAFIVASGAAAMGFEVSMYFTFWGLIALKKKTVYAGKPMDQKMVSMMLPRGPESADPSRMAFGGAGGAFFRHLMKKHNVATLPELIETCKEMGVRLIACRMAMGVMGIVDEELRDDIEYGGVGTYLGCSLDSKLTLFI